MHKNLLLADRIIRMLLGICLLAWAFAGGPSWAYLGLYLSATGAWGVCPFYWIFKINS